MDQSWQRGIVNVVEPYGSETHVLFDSLFDSAGANLIARLPRGDRPEHCQKVIFSVAESSAHLFSAQDGTALRPGVDMAGR